MPLTLTDIKLYGSASMPDDATPTNIGGALSTSKKVSFADINGSAQLVSSSGSDITQAVTLSFRLTSGVLTTEAKTLGGTTPVLYLASIERLLKGVKGATTNGAVAVEHQTAVRQNTAQGGSINTIQFDVGASAVNGFYNGMIVRLISGPGAEQINEVIDYDGTSKTATMRDYWHGTLPTNATVFRVAAGFFFDKLPNEVTEVRRIHFDASAQPLGQGAINYYDKVFFVNSSNTNALLNAQVIESLNPSARESFGVEAIVNGTNSNGVGNNRNVAPSGIVFATTPTTVPGSNLNAGSSIGVWMRLALLEADAPQKTSTTMQLSGSTV
jgi:hypothetical protein